MCASQAGVAVYSLNTPWEPRELLNVDTIFSVPYGTSAREERRSFKNVRSDVLLEGGRFSFRNHNPPSLAIRNQRLNIRDGECDVDAMLQHYTNHPTTPPFIARTLIQRMTTSNPSPRYVAAVATAFKTGVYHGIGDGARGDLAATTAAIVLDREAQSGELEHGANHGGLREPLLKVIHMLRALELETAADAAGQHQELCRAGGVQRRERFQLLSA